MTTPNRYMTATQSDKQWAREATAGDYLAYYDDCDDDDRCGRDDAQLDEIRRILGRRGLDLVADYRGLVADAERTGR